MGKKVNLNQKRTNSDMTKLNKNKNFNSRRVYNGFTKINSQPRPIENDSYQDLQDSREKNEISDVKIRIPLPIKMLATIVIFVPLLILMLFVTVFGDFGEGSSSGIGLSGYDYYAGACDKVKVNNNLISIEEYVAGVLNVEVPGFTEPETLKTMSIAARSFTLSRYRKVGEDDDCYYEINDTTDSSQGYTSKEASEAIQNAVKATRGLIITVDGVPKGNYDASCVYTAEQARAASKDQNFEDGYYYIRFGEWNIGEVHYQKIEKEKAKSIGTLGSYVSKAESGGACSGNHGGGISQNGLAYLETYENYDLNKMVDYYYNGKAKIVSIYKGFSGTGNGYSGDYPIEPNNELYSNNKFLINTTISNVLSNNGSSLEKFNENLKSEIEKAGVGTREASVAAAVTLIGSLAEQGFKLNYQWGGKYEYLGINADWGKSADTSACNTSYVANGYVADVCTTNYRWSSFDCSGFVTWAILNGMQGRNSPGGVTINQKNIFNSKATSLKSNEAVCKIGGVLQSSGHIVLVVGHDDVKKQYIVAESTGSRLETGHGGVVLSYYPYGNTDLSRGYYWCSNLDDIYGD